MKNRWKRIFRIGAVVIASVLFLVIAFSLFVYFNKPILKNYLEKALEKKIGLTVEIGRLNYRLFPLRVEADSVKVVFAGKLGRMDMRVGRAEASGSFSRLIHNQKPYFDFMTVSGLKLEFAGNPNPPPSGPSKPVNIRDLARLVSGALEYIGDLDIKDSTLHLSLPVHGMDFSAAGVSLKAAETDSTAIELSATRLDVRKDKPKAALAAGFHAKVIWPRSDPFSLEGNLDLTAISVSLPEKPWSGTGFGLTAGFRAGEHSVAVSSLTFDMPDLVALSGSGRVEWGRSAVITTSSKLNIKNIELVKKAFAPFLPPGLPSFFAGGGVLWEGDVTREAASGAAKISVNGTLRLPPAHFIMKRADLAVDQVLQAELHVQGAPDGLHFGGFIEGRQGRLDLGSVQAKGFSFRLPIEIQGSRVNISSFQAQSKELVVSAGSRKLKLEGLSISGKTKIDLLNRTAEISSLTVAVPRLGDITLAGEVGLNPKRKVALAFSSRNLNVGNVLAYFPGLDPAAVSAWKPRGQLDLSLEIKNGPSDPRRFKVKGTGNLSKIAFQDASGAIVSEGLEPRLRFEADVLSLVQAVPFSLQVDLAKGESLWKDMYFNWLSEPIRLEFKGTFEPRLKHIRDIAAAVSFAPLGEIRVGGSLGFGPQPRFDFHLAAPSIDLASMSAFWGKLKPGQPSAWDIRGAAEAEADIRLGRSFEIRGTVKIRETAVAQQDGSFKLAGIEADFPFSVSNGARPGDEKKNYSITPGHIQIQEIKTPVAVLSPLRVDFLSARNLFLFFPFDIGLWGSRLGLKHSVLFISPASLQIWGVSSLTLSELDLAKLPFNSESFNLVGRASIPSIGLEIRPGEFRFKGRLLADMFGGQLTMDDIRLMEVFSPGRRIIFQAEIAGLDLKKLTDSVPFGEVTGIVDVSIRDFSLSYGQPENFVLSIVSVPRKGVARKFSLKAVDNLSVISSNGPSAVPSSNILTKFINSFNYSRIGIACSLKNDVFSLQGTIIEEGIQYLVRRSAFFGIDVVNGTPVNRIGFQDMLSRIKRIGKSQEKK
jgi:hypothetical protein